MHKSVSFIILCLFLLFSGCCKDACKDVDCGPNGFCVDGTCDCSEGYSGVNCQVNCASVNCNNGTCDPDTGECICDEGYEGDFCDMTIAAKFLGTWIPVEWECSNATTSMTSFTLIQGSEPNQFFFEDDGMMQNLYGFADGTTFTIPLQNDIGVFETFEGDGMLLENGNLLYNITATFEGSPLTCTGTFMME